MSEARDDRRPLPLPLPHPLGRVGRGGWLLAALAASGLAIGLYAYSRQLLHGDIVTGMRTISDGGAAWGFYICFDMFFVGVSFAGIAIALLARLLRIESLRPISRIALLLTIVSLAMGGCCVLADLGRPLKGLLNLPRYARTMSPFFGTFSLVIGGSLFATLVYLFLSARADAAECARRGGSLSWLYRIWACGFRGTDGERRRHRTVSFWLSLAILPLLLFAHSTLGFIFGIQGGRPGWFSALQAPGFVVMAAASGTALLIVIVAILRRALHLESTIRLEAFRWLRNFLLVLVAISLYFLVVEQLTASYASNEADTRVAREIVAGAYARSFWTFVACLVAAFLLLFTQYARSVTSIGACVAAALIVDVGAVLKRLLLIVPSQTHGMLLPYPDGRYAPTWVEVGVVLGLFSLATLLFQAFTVFFPIVPISPLVPRSDDVAPLEPPMRRAARTTLFIATLICGLAMAIGGFLFSARVGADHYVDPALPLSPVIFIVGVMLSFYSAAVYETLPVVPRRDAAETTRA